LKNLMKLQKTRLKHSLVEILGQGAYKPGKRQRTNNQEKSGNQKRRLKKN